MNKPQRSVQSEITKIFNEYYAKLDEINKKLDERYSQPIDKESNNSIDNNYKKLAEIIIRRHQESQNIHGEAEQVNNEASEIINELESKIRKAKTIIDECENELHIKYSDLDKVVAGAWKKLDVLNLKTLKEKLI